LLALASSPIVASTDEPMIDRRPSGGTRRRLLAFSTALAVGLHASAVHADVVINGAITSPVNLESPPAGTVVPPPGGTNARVESGGSVSVGSGTAVTTQNLQWTIINLGTVQSGNGVGINLQNGTTLTNDVPGLISGTTTGVNFQNGSAALTNAGTIQGTAGIGANLQPGGTVVNSGVITGATEGLHFQNGSAALTNSGIIQGTGGIGVTLQPGGTVVNSGIIVGTTEGLHFQNGSATLDNSGTIQATAGVGVFIQPGGTVQNGSGGTIRGTTEGLHFQNGTATLINGGTVEATGGIGVFVQPGNGSVQNNGGTITGATKGVQFTNGPGSLTNSGTVSTGASGIAVDLMNGGTVTNSGMIGGGATGVHVRNSPANVTNAAGGAISGTQAGVSVENAAGSIDNAGAIGSGAGRGIQLLNGGTVTNTGSVAGQTAGISVTGAGTINNAGTIAGVGRSVEFLSGNGTLNLNTGSTLIGPADGGTSSALNLFGTGTATNDFARFASVNMMGTDWTLAGTTEAPNTFVRTGRLTLAGTLLGTQATIDPGSALQIGAGGASGTFGGNVVDNGSLIFNRSDVYVFPGTITGSGAVLQIGPGVTVLPGSYTYTGATTVALGTLRVNGSITSRTNVLAGGTLGGIGTIVGDVFNAGVVAPGNSIGTLTVLGNYVGQGGILRLETVLGGDGSPSSRLVINGGTATGQTGIAIVNVGGAGAATVSDGILVVQAINGGTTAPAAFSLSGRAVAGAFEYNLFRGGLTNPNDNNWYLRSATPVPPEPGPTPPIPPTPGPPVIRPEVGAYLANQRAAGGLFLHTLHDRLGEAQFLEPITLDARDPQRYSVWLRGDGRTSSVDGAGNQFHASADAGLVQGGGDIAFRSLLGDRDRLLLGLMGAWGTVQSRVRSDNNANEARASVDAYSIGAYTTWYQNNTNRLGLYADLWFLYGWYNQHVKGDFLPAVDYDATAWTFSGEVGYALPLGAGWVLEPQGQLLGILYDQPRATEDNGTVITGASGTGLVSRLGARVYRTFVPRETWRLEPFLGFNWWHDRASDSSAINGLKFSDLFPTNRYEVKLGVHADFGRGWGAWANVGLQLGAQDYQQFAGRIGVKYAW
jgi:outer membrane autotransporter protein